MNTPSPKSFLFRFVKITKWIFYTFLGGTLLVIFASLGFYFYISKDLPKLDKIEDYRPPVMAEVFDDTGKKIGEFWTEARILTPIDQIPQKMIQGFVASEDDRFFQHSGVDPYGIVRAFWKNFQAGRVVQGASTITQQVTKALLLSPERTYDRKIKEAILATKIESSLTKDQILYIYLNQTFFGNRAYGVGAAARNYFHKNLGELNIAEMAMIVGLAKAPSRFDPIINPERAEQRKNYVIDRMMDEGYITAAEAQQAKIFPLKIYKAGTDKDFNIKYAPYFVEHVRRNLQKKYGDQLYTGGWKIYTTGSLLMNQEAQRAVAEGMEVYTKRFGYRGPIKHLSFPKEIDQFTRDYHFQILDEFEKLNYFGDPDFKNAMAIPTPLESKRRYQAVITEVGDKSIRVKVGNQEGNISKEDWAWAKNPARLAKAWSPQVGDVVEVKLKTQDSKNNVITTVLNQFTLVETPEVQAAIFSYEPFSGGVKAIVGGQSYQDSEFNRATQALRQPGSAIKPLVYAAALDKGYNPTTVISDAPIVYEESPGKFWSPKNYGGKYYGPTMFRNGLVNSRNVVTVRILMDIGTHYAAGFMRKVGIISPIFKYYSMALGANDLTLAELSSAYGTFVTGGIRPNIHFITKIVDSKGNIIEEYQDPKSPFMVTYKNIDESASKDKNQKNETVKTTQQEEKNEDKTKASKNSPETQKSSPQSWEDIGYNPKLLGDAEITTQGDDLHLTDYEKKVLYGDYIPEGYTISPKTAMTMVSILRDVVRAGTGTRAQALKKPAGGKTGTTNNETDAWFIAFTPSLLTGVWVGFDEKIRTLGRGATGGHTAAPIWLAYMLEATKNYPTQDFVNTSGIDFSAYDTPMQMVQGGGDAEMGDEGVGTGIASGPSAGGGASSSAEFFTRDLE